MMRKESFTAEHAEITEGKDKVADMNLKKVNIELDVSDVREILAIDMDDDAGRALAFIKEHLAKQVKKCLQPH
jgi:hypothetical protein